MRRAQTCAWARTRRCDEPSNALGPSPSYPSCQDCIIATRGYDFREGQEFVRPSPEFLSPCSHRPASPPPHRREIVCQSDAAVFLAISREIATVVDGDRRCCCGDVFEATQQARLVVLDLHDQVIAGVAGDLEGFFGSAWRRA